MRNTEAISGRSARAAGLLLDDRRQDQRFVRVLERQVRRAARPRRVEPRAHQPVGAGEQRGVGRAVHEEVGVGKEPALRARALGAEPAQQLGVGQVDAASSAIAGSSGSARFRSAKVAPSTTVSDVCSASPCVSLSRSRGQRDAGVDLVVAGLDRAVDAAQAGERHQRQLAGHDAGRRPARARPGAGSRRRGPRTRTATTAAAAAARATTTRRRRPPRASTASATEHGEQPAAGGGTDAADDRRFGTARKGVAGGTAKSRAGRDAANSARAAGL